MVVLDERALSLEYSDGDSGLLVLVGGEGLGFLGWDNSTTLDNRGHHSSDGLNSEGKGCHINEKDILCFLSGLATENTSLYSGTKGYSLIWVDSTVWLFSVEVFLKKGLDLWDTGGSTDKHDFVNFRFLESRLFEDIVDWFESVLEEIVAKFLEFGSGESLLEIDTIHDTLDVDLNLLNSGQVTLSFLNFRFKFLECSHVALDIDVVLLLECFDEEFSDTLIKVLSTKMGITRSCKYLEHSIINGKERNIESTTTKIEHNNVLLIFLVKTVGNGCC